MNEQLDAKCSLCWKCTFGLTIKETDSEHVYTQPNTTRNIGGHEPDFLVDFGESVEESELEQEPDLIEHTLDHERVRTVCYWRPAGVEHTPPIGVANVVQCSRFESRDDQQESNRNQPKDS